MAGGLLLAPLLAWTRRYWRAAAENRQEERLLRAFLEMAQDVSPNEIGAARLSARAAAIRANLRDPDPVLHRLVRKDHIRPDTEYPRHYTISSKGRARARISFVVGVLRLAGPMTLPVPMRGSCARSTTARSGRAATIVHTNLTLTKDLQNIGKKNASECNRGVSTVILQ